MDKRKKDRLLLIPLLFMGPIALVSLILLALLNLLQFFLKVALLFSIAAIHTPFAVMINSSIFVVGIILDSSFDPRVAVRIELKAIVSDFFKVIATELLLVLSTGVITFYTASKLAFYISMAVGVAAIQLKWLNTDSLSKTAFSCICDGYGLNPMMFFFSFIGFFDIGCHPIAKCSFVAPNAIVLKKKKVPTDGKGWSQFNEKEIDSKNKKIEFSKWDAFDGRCLFRLNPRIDFIEKNNGKFILKSFMVLRLLGMKFNLCEYFVERLELPQDYTKTNELYNFLVALPSQDGFVTDKMRGRYEHSLTLLEIVRGVEESDGYVIEKSKDEVFIVA